MRIKQQTCKILFHLKMELRSPSIRYKRTIAEQSENGKKKIMESVRLYRHTLIGLSRFHLVLLETAM